MLATFRGKIGTKKHTFPRNRFHGAHINSKPTHPSSKTKRKNGGRNKAKPGKAGTVHENEFATWQPSFKETLGTCATKLATALQEQFVCLYFI